MLGRISLTVAIVLMSSGLAACGATSTATAPPPQPTSTAAGAVSSPSQAAIDPADATACQQFETMDTTNVAVVDSSEATDHNALESQLRQAFIAAQFAKNAYLNEIGTVMACDSGAVG